MITVERLTKRYGPFTAVDDVSFEVKPGLVTGFLGPNGAGKTTAMRVMAGLTPATSGRATVLGKPYAALPNPGRHVGLLLDASAQHAGRTGREVLTLGAILMGVGKHRVDEMVELVGLTEKEANRRVRNYSLGMRQRLGIAHALLGDPEVLILDEPANGLDPAGIRWMRDLLRGYANEGGTVLLSSHLLNEIERVADEIIVIGHGTIVAQGTKDELLAGAGTFTRSTDDEALLGALAAVLDRRPAHPDRRPAGRGGAHRRRPRGRRPPDRPDRAARRRQPGSRGDVPRPHGRHRPRGGGGMTATTSTTPPPRRRRSPRTPSRRCRPHAKVPSRIAGPRPTTGVPFGRLVHVELRKMLDTRAGRWLMIGIGAIIAIALTIMFFNKGGQHAFGEYLQATTMPMALILPVVGILAVTSEWSQRTGLVTFGLEPRRMRIAWAKLLSALLVGVCAFALALVLAALAHQAAITFRGIAGDWSIGRLVLLGAGGYVLLGIAQGVGFGMLFKNTPAAVVVFFVLPTAWSILGSMVSWLGDAAVWLDLNQTMNPLFEGSLTGAQWAHLGTSVAVWVVAPLAVGIWRLTRAEVK